MTLKPLKHDNDLISRIYITLALLFVGAFIVSIVLGKPAQSATSVYEWVNREGSLCWTNVEKRVPKAFRDQVVTRLVDGLDSYPKYTPVGKEDYGVDE